MYNHAPRKYICPFCTLVQSFENDDIHNTQKTPFPAGSRSEYAQKLRAWFRNIEQEVLHEKNSFIGN